MVLLNSSLYFSVVANGGYMQVSNYCVSSGTKDWYKKGLVFGGDGLCPQRLLSKLKRCLFRAVGLEFKSPRVQELPSITGDLKKV